MPENPFADFVNRMVDEKPTELKSQARKAQVEADHIALEVSFEEFRSPTGNVCIRGLICKHVAIQAELMSPLTQFWTVKVMNDPVEYYDFQGSRKACEQAMEEWANAQVAELGQFIIEGIPWSPEEDTEDGND